MYRIGRHHNIGEIVLNVLYILIVVVLLVFVISFWNLKNSDFTLTQIVIDPILKGITSVDYIASVNQELDNSIRWFRSLIWSLAILFFITACFKMLKKH